MLASNHFSLRPVLERAIQAGASDVHFVAGKAPLARLHGRLTPLEGPALSPEDTLALAKDLLEPEAFDHLSQTLDDMDGAFSLEGLGRFRINVYRQKGCFSLALRILPLTPPPLDSLGLPQPLSGLANKHTGIVLVTGPTGSGKSTSLAAMIDQVNRTQRKHIITIEDPIEYLHSPQMSMVTQREIGRDAASFSGALRASLRQDPDVILVGEMRDLTTIQTALTAAETGHLVFSTLHTNSAVETIHRIVDIFPTHQQAQIRQQLAANLQGIISQKLLPLADGQGRTAATELLIPTGAIRHLIREGKTHQIQSAITTGRKQGMQTMDMSLAQLFKAGKITRETALDHASDPDNIERLLQLG